MATDYGVRRESLDAMLADTPYRAYTYSYPHKTSYRPFAPPKPLDEVWRDEDRSSLFLYAHVPFCEMRCGFCNLFTTAKPREGVAPRYLEAMRRQARVVRKALGEDVGWARLAIGGGTPTQLDVAGLEDLFDILTDEMGCPTLEIPVAVEMSPETVTPEKMRLLRERGTNRASVGVQSFLRAETKAVRRPQEPAVAHAALETMRDAGFETINVDLIYGMPGQTPETWRHSLDEALLHRPEEVYLYPLYVRPKTGLGNSPKSWDDLRLDLYRRGRDYLLERGYEQTSMRMFRRRDLPNADAPEYVCQRDGMVGLGAGARSYTERVHYCTEYAVGRRGVLEILHDFLQRDDRRLGQADYGFELDEEERRRRDAILSLLSSEGLDETRYTTRFGRSPRQDLPQLDELLHRALAVVEDDVMRLTDDGMERSDVIGPWLYSDRVTDRMREYELR
jgi:oxygen-independent coproporphyrinogen-3 oxidase